jgi:hypothetical protein
MNGVGLVRQPNGRLAEGIVTHISRTPVDVAVARAQHGAYADALAASDWMIQHGGDRVLIAASAPRTAGLLADLGFTPVVVDISEFEKLEGCVTCLSVLLPVR